MRFALVNPPWSFEGSIYFGCREPHLPLEYGYSKALLGRAGHEAEIVDAQLDRLSLEEVRERVAALAPDVTVITTAPSYLFWRCAPPELRVPMQAVGALRDVGGTFVVVGPHASTTPGPTLRKLGVDLAVLGECEEVLLEMAEAGPGRWEDLPHVYHPGRGRVPATAGRRAADMAALPALRWPDETVARHAHHHHRFDATPAGPGAEMEVSRGCPYRCSFCAKENFRNKYRKRPLGVVLEELDGLLAQGAEYVYFVDEIFLPDRALLEALVERPVKFGVQTRIDLWDFGLLDLLGAAGCVSVEAGVESITPEGRDLLDKKCKLSTEELTERLVRAKRTIPFVQANLIDAHTDDPSEIRRWREGLAGAGVWANEPVPLFAYPGSPDYARLWGEPDDAAWERALDAYLSGNDHYSDIQEERPLPLVQLEVRG